jgi:RNA polymerase sigma-70 factor (ECF subfamily)
MTDELVAEKEILERIAARDHTGFDLMVERYSAMLYRYALRMCGEPAEAEDALQETFLIAQQKIGQFRGEGRLRNWLFKITANACRQRHRTRQGRLSTELRLEDVMSAPEDSAEHEPPSWQKNPVENLLSAEMAEHLEAAIAMVPPINRSVLLLRDLEGLTTRETAHVLEISEEAVKVRLHRARAYVRNQLKDYFEERK